MRKSLIVLSLILIVLATIALVITHLGIAYAHWQAEPTYMWPSIIGLFVLTVSIHRLSLYLSESRPNDFVPFYLLIMVSKLLIYLIYNLVMIVSAPLSAPANVVFFFGVYISFTLAETILIFIKINSRKG